MIINFAIGYHCKPVVRRTVCVYRVMKVALSSGMGGKRRSHPRNNSNYYDTQLTPAVPDSRSVNLK